VFDMPAQVAALALGQLDNEYTMDLAVSAGDELVIVHGRDRKLSLDETERAKVSPALVTQRKFPSNIASLVLGNFTGDSGTDVARAPVAVLPMRLTASALYSVTLLTKGQTAPVIAKIEPNNTFVVTNTNATGPGSLQFAILDANETPGADLISFNIPGAGPFTISLINTLPTITDPVTIDGTTQPGFACTPVIEL